MGLFFGSAASADTQYIRIDLSKSSSQMWATVSYSFSCPTGYVITGFIDDGSPGTCRAWNEGYNEGNSKNLTVTATTISNSITVPNSTAGTASCNINGYLVCAKTCNYPP
jgi:hypothetical protein